MLTPQQAYEAARTGECVIGWKLDRGQREHLLTRFPPHYSEAVADHVTLVSRVASDAPLPGETGAEIVGRSDDGTGVEAMVVRLGGTTDRPDGSIYHITWSLEPGRHARESNAVIAASGWAPIDPPIALALTPARF